jgi:hypothetical protein
LFESQIRVDLECPQRVRAKKLPKRKTEGFASLGCCSIPRRGLKNCSNAKRQVSPVRSVFRVAPLGPLEKLFKNKTFSFIFKVFFGTHSTSACQKIEIFLKDKMKQHK